MNSVSYVSSETNKVQQAKLNNVITSLKDFVACTTNDKTEQEYGVIEYNGAICLGQTIKGNKKPRTRNVPVISNNNVFLGYLDETGSLVVSNNKQIYNTASSLCMTGTGTSAVCCSSIQECDTKYNISCTCEIKNTVEKNKLTTETTWNISDCCIICENMQQCIASVYNGSACAGYGCTTFFRDGENNQNVKANNRITVNGREYNWTSPTLVCFDANTQKIVCVCDNKAFVDCCLHSAFSSSYNSVLCSCKNGLDFEMTLNCIIVDTVTYSTTDCVSILEKYI